MIKMLLLWPFQSVSISGRISRRDYYKKRGNIFSMFSRSSEAFASELLESLKEMFPQRHLSSNRYGNIFSRSKYSTTQ